MPRRSARLLWADWKPIASSSIMRVISVDSGVIAMLAGISGLMVAAATWSALVRRTMRSVTAWPALVVVVEISATSAPGVRLLSRKVPSALVRVLISPASHTPLSLASKQTLADLNTEATVLEALLAAGEVAAIGAVK